jgi:hypothetical protein
MKLISPGDNPIWTEVIRRQEARAARDGQKLAANTCLGCFGPVPWYNPKRFLEFPAGRVWHFSCFEKYGVAEWGRVEAERNAEGANA